MIKININMLRSLVYVLFLSMVFLSSCLDEPELPPEPVISLKNSFFKPTNSSNLDSLIIEIGFQDGDGDLGLVSFDTLPPFHEYDLVMKYDGSGYIKLEDRDTQEYDTLPPYGNGTSGCLYWEPVGDSVYYVNRNPHRYNFRLDILVQNNNGNFEVYDFLEERCTSGLSGRFFPLNTTGKERPLEGTLRYGIQAGFRFLFPVETLKVRVNIEDRRLNLSNTVESEPFTLSQYLNI